MYHNEGGMQENLNILPEITEEAYLINSMSWVLIIAHLNVFTSAFSD